MADEFEHGEEEADAFAVRASLKHAGEREFAGVGAREAIDKVFLVERDRRVVVLDHVVADARDIDRCGDALKGRVEVAEVKILQLPIFGLGVAGFAVDERTVLRVGVGGLRGFDGSCAHAGRGAQAEVAAARVEHFGRGAELLVGEQLADELRLRILARSCSRARVAILRRRSGRERPRLDLDEGRRHHEEFASEVDVDLGDVADIFEVAIGQRVDFDVVDIDLGTADEEQQQVERTLEGGKANKPVILRHHRGI